MVPIHQLLNRIRWDEEFGRGRFDIGYLDQVEQRIVLVPFRQMRLEEGNRFSFELETPDGEFQVIPFHRVREVYKDGRLIWQRPAHGL